MTRTPVKSGIVLTFKLFGVLDENGRHSIHLLAWDRAD